MQQTQQLRPFTETENGIALTTSAAVHYLIWMLDQLQHTNMFRMKLKQTGNSFLAELEKHSKQIVWDESVEGSDIGAKESRICSTTCLFCPSLAVNCRKDNRNYSGLKWGRTSNSSICRSGYRMKGICSL